MSSPYHTLTATTSHRRRMHAWRFAVRCGRGLLRLRWRAPRQTEEAIGTPHRQSPGSAAAKRTGKVVLRSYSNTLSNRVAQRLLFSRLLIRMTGAENPPPQTLGGSLSAVSKPNFARKYSLESSRRDLHHALLCTVLQSQNFSQKSSTFFRE